MKIEIISGSARPQRKSHQVALTLQQKLREEAGIEAGMLDVMEYQFPLLEYVYASHPAPTPGMKAFSDRLNAAQAFIVVSPEHNGSYPGALKNTMDHFFKEYAGKPFGIVTVSNGALGGISAMKNLQQYGLTLKAMVCPAGLITPKVNELFADGKLTNEEYGSRLSKFIGQFLEFAEKWN